MHIIASILKFIFKSVPMAFFHLCWLYTKFVITFLIIIGTLCFLSILATLDSDRDIPSPLDHKLLLIKPSGLVTDHHVPEINLLVNSITAEDESIAYTDEIVKAIDFAAKDQTYVEGIILDLSSLGSISYGTANVIGNALKSYEEQTGKKVYAYSNTYNQHDYYLASYASTIVVNPAGNVDLHGITIGQPYFKELLDSWGVTPQIFKCGKYKSAVEPFTNQEMSEASRENLNSIIEDFWNSISSVIAKNRNIPAQNLLRNIDDELSDLKNVGFNTIEDLKKRKLIDEVLSSEEFFLKLQELYPSTRTNTENHLALINFQDYINQQEFSISDDNNLETNKPEIAVIYLTGEVDSSQETFHISYATYKNLFTKIAYDKNIKAVVLRINTPGGSVDEAIKIANGINFLKKFNKKIVVSMGEIAASAGYWISSGADFIYAEPTTLTGSIGVFGIVPSVHKLAEKYGVHYDEATNNPHHYTNPLQEMDSREKELIEGRINYIYDTFLTIVSTGRNMDKNGVHNIAQGRVWTGVQAQKIGLVDEIGSLKDAIDKSSELAGIKSNYDTEHYYGDDKMKLGILQSFFAKSSVFSKLIPYLPESFITQFKMAYPVFKGVPQNQNAKIYSYLPLVLED